MGWLYRKQKFRHETPVEYFKRELTFSDDDVSATVLDAAAVRGTVYAAVRTLVDYIERMLIEATHGAW